MCHILESCLKLDHLLRWYVERINTPKRSFYLPCRHFTASAELNWVLIWRLKQLVPKKALFVAIIRLSFGNPSENLLFSGAFEPGCGTAGWKLCDSLWFGVRIAAWDLFSLSMVTLSAIWRAVLHIKVQNFLIPLYYGSCITSEILL